MSTDNIYSELLSSRPELISKIWPKWNDYIPVEPTGKELAFLLLNQLEAFFGGAAGGGKSEALLIGALQYVDVPGYSAIIFRKTLSDLNLPESLMSRANEWLYGYAKDDLRRPIFKGQDHKWVFPSGAILQFGYIGEVRAKQRYQGSSYQFVGFDEVCQHYDWDYLYMFSRLRRPQLPCIHCKTPIERSSIQTGYDLQDEPLFEECWVHVNDVPCETPVPNPIALKRFPRNAQGVSIYDVPLRMRCTANPPQPGDASLQQGNWVKKRFLIKECPVSPQDDIQANPLARKILAPDGGLIQSVYRGTNPDKPMIPSYVWDNPYLNQEEYLTKTLAELDPVTRAQLSKGDWGVSIDGRFRRAWKKVYSWNGENVILGPHRRPYPHLDVAPIHGSYFAKNLRCFMTMDIASSSKAGPGDTDIYINTVQSHTVLSTFLLTPRNDLLWLRIRRERMEIPEVLKLLRDEYHAVIKLGYNVELIGIEENNMGVGVVQIAQRQGFPIRPIWTSTDKLSNSADAANRMEQGKIFFPEESGVTIQGQSLDLEVLESELYTWLGHSTKELNDQIDTLSNAAKFVSIWAGEDNRITNFYEQPEMM